MSIVNPKKFKSVINHLTDKCIQPNAVDIVVIGFNKIKDDDIFVLSESSKQHRGSIKIYPDENGVFVLDEGHYEFITQHNVTIADNEAGIIIPRSTLNRNGVFITSGLYDSGFEGTICGVMHINGPTNIKVGTRIAQFLIFDAESCSLYNGSYGKNGELNDRYDDINNDIGIK